MKLLLAFLTVSSVTVTADLIGYNRLGNNVNGHVFWTKKMKKNNYKNYMKQLQHFISENPSKSLQNTKKFLKKKNPKKNFARRNFYSEMMSSLYLNN